MELNHLTSYHACILQARAYRSMREFMVAQLKRHDLTMMEWALLGLVHDAGHRGVTHTAIAEAIDVGLPMVSHMVERVSAQGLVKQQQSTDDRRKKVVSLTPKGRDIISRTEKDIRSALRQWMQPIALSDIEAYVSVMAALGDLSQPEPDLS